MVNILIIVFVLEVLCLTDTYDFSCPSQSHWKLRAKYKCTHQSNYSCLFDVDRQINVYRERCLNSRIIGHGYKYVFQPNPNLGECSLSRYQPFIFNTTGYSDCVFLKSFCNSEGQTTYKDDTRGSDRTCTCNTEFEYHFVRPPNNRCYCHPSIEDCSCYIGIHQNSTTNVLKDLDCNGKINISTQEDALDTSKASQINNFYNTKYNIAFRPTNQYRMKAAVCILVLVVLYPIAVVIYILQRNKRQRRKKIKGLKKVTKAYGAEAVLRTKIKADVRNLTWMHQHDIDNIQEIPSDDCKYSKCDTSKTLEILDLCKKDSGTYFCKVIMPKGTVRYSLKKEVEVIEPVLTLKDSEKRADCGQTVTLKCAIKHPPKHYEVTWEKDADTIQLNDAKYMGSTQDFPHLTIKDVDHGDNALYCFCITYKPSTDEEEKFKCRSKVKLLVNEPSIQMFRLEEQVVMGHNISIECTINQIRKIYDVIWEKIPANNEEYSEALLFEKQTEEKYEKKMSKTKTQHLKIKKADEFDDAFYRCCIQYESAGVDHIVCSEEFRLLVVASAKDINKDLKPDFAMQAEGVNEDLTPDFAMQGAALTEDKIQHDNNYPPFTDENEIRRFRSNSDLENALNEIYHDLTAMITLRPRSRRYSYINGSFEYNASESDEENTDLTAMKTMRPRSRRHSYIDRLFEYNASNTVDSCLSNMERVANLYGFIIKTGSPEGNSLLHAISQCIGDQISTHLLKEGKITRNRRIEYAQFIESYHPTQSGIYYNSCLYLHFQELTNTEYVEEWRLSPYWRTGERTYKDAGILEAISNYFSVTICVLFTRYPTLCFISFPDERYGQRKPIYLGYMHDNRHYVRLEKRQVCQL